MKELKLNGLSRADFIRRASAVLGGTILMNTPLAAAFGQPKKSAGVKVFAHLWVYASKYPPHWDCFENLDNVFADLSFAGIEGVEIMENILRHEDALSRLQKLSKKYDLPVSGSSYGIGRTFSDAAQHLAIEEDIKYIVPILRKLHAKTLGISVGGVNRKKTEKELDAQALLLKKIAKICADYDIVPNLHNHTYEVENNMHDLLGTMARVPNMRLGPDLNWLIRGGIDPVQFIQQYGHKISYLHLRDQDAAGVWTEYLGQGATDFISIATALKDQQFAGNVAIELAFPNNFTPKNSLKEDWKISRQFVQQTFGW
jgi:sugar phosphate isomerase/epimerase